MELNNQNVFRLFAIFLILVMLSFSIYLYLNNKNKSDLEFIDKFNNQYDIYSNMITEMNNIIVTYNSESVLLFERLDLIDDYLNYYSDFLIFNNNFYNFIINNEKKIKSNGYNYDQIINEISLFNNSVNENILIIKQDLLEINNSILLDYTDARQEQLNLAYNKIDSFNLN
jgi:hypothetical protein